SSFLPSDLLAAFLYAQFEARDRIQARRQQIWQCYYDCLQDWAYEQDVRLPIIPAECEQPYHMFFLLLPGLEQRQKFIEQLKTQAINCVFHYLPLHLSEMGQRLGGKPGDCPVSEEMSDGLVRLPFYNGLTESDQMRVVQTIRKINL